MFFRNLALFASWYNSQFYSTTNSSTSKTTRKTAMCKSMKINGLRPASFVASALLGLTTLLVPIQQARAQSCAISLADGPGVPDEKFVHVGDTVHFFIHLNADATVCILQGGTNWAILPDGTVHQIVNDYA